MTRLKAKQLHGISSKWKYDLLHEIGHLICGYTCCREHEEFEAHGAAKTLAALLDIDIGDAEERMDCYAGRSAHGACGRIERRDKRKGK